MLDFPGNPPTSGTTFTAPNGSVYQYDGAKWVAIGNLAPSSTLPIMDGTAAVGTSAAYARSDHIHPSDTSRYAASNPSGYQTAAQVTTALAPYAPLASPTFTGTVTIPAGASISGYAPIASPAFTGTPTCPAPNGALTGYAGSTTMATMGSVRQGVTDGGAAATGQIGELVTFNTPNTAPGNAAPTSVVYGQLTAGDWDVWGYVSLAFSANNGSFVTAGIGTTANSIAGLVVNSFTPSSAIIVGMGLVPPMQRVSFSATAYVYLNAQANFASGTCTPNGILYARRVR